MNYLGSDWAGVITTVVDSAGRIGTAYYEAEKTKTEGDTLTKLATLQAAQNQPPSSSGIDTTTIALVGGGVALLVVVALMMKKK